MGSREVLSPALKVLIVGAGIAGLAAAISCRRAGHDVTVYERSALNNEVGAAIHICPNASRGLLAWGFDPTKARFVTSKSTYRAFGTNLERFYEIDAGHIEETFGAPWYFAHRVDLHEELKRIATQVEGEGKPVEVCLRAEVAKFDPEGSITLADGSIFTGDLIIAAEGVHSEAVEVILGAPNPAHQTTHYNYAYRFLIPSSEIAADPETADFIKNDDGILKIFVGDGHRLIWYPCRNNEVQNFVALFNNDQKVAHEDWQTSVDSSDLLDRYSDFHPSIIAILKKAKDIKQWPLLFRAPIPIWHKNKLVLIGDAAHPMLPHQAQGGCQAIEDAVALGISLTDSTPASLESRLQTFDSIRRTRASAIQIFSNAGADEPEKIRAEAAKFIPEDTIPKNPDEFVSFNYGYDVVRDSVRAMEKGNPGWTLPATFFEKEPGKGVYP